MKKVAYATLFSIAAGLASGAQAQTALGNGVTLGVGASSGSFSSVELGSTAGTGWVSQMPMSLSYSGVDLNIAFSGASGVSAMNASWNPTPGKNFFSASGSIDFQFSSAQTYFGMAWSSPDTSNQLSFYNGSQLITTLSGSQFRSISGVSNFSLGAYAEFSFSEIGYDRVVVSSPFSGGDTSAPRGGLEFGDVRFGNPTPEAAPLPLGSAGGLVAFLGMMGARRRGLSWREAMREANPFPKMREAQAA